MTATGAPALPHVQRVLDRLERVKGGASKWTARCPAHDDQRASLSIGIGRSGDVLFHCHANAGCTAESIVAQLGLTMADLRADGGTKHNGNGQHTPDPKARARRVATYDFRDEHGTILYRTERIEEPLKPGQAKRDKFYVQSRPDGAGGWTKGLEGISRRLLYRLPELLEDLGAERRVFVVEGERKADLLRERGLPATSWAGGAGSWRDEFAATLAGADVVLLPDNDDPGRRVMQQAAYAIRASGGRVRTVELPGLPPKGDVVDWFASGHSTDELEALVERTPTEGPPDAATLDAAAQLFQKWLHLPDTVPLYAVLGAIAANHLPGDPVWLGVVAPPSSAKTEILNATNRLSHLHSVATLTVASLLSGTSQRDRAKGATGGLLREVGDFGILVLKDFGSILTLRPDAKAEVLQALREIYDGAWVRRVGTDGGQALSWSGKLGLIFGATPALDSHHSVIAAMGERFLLCRLPAAGMEQAAKALAHAGSHTATMRQELAEVVTRVFAASKREPRALTPDETHQLVRWASLAVRLRSTVERDRQSREIESIHGAEGPARLVLTLERLLAGLDALHCDRAHALRIVERVALDSVPPLRRRAFEYLRAQTVAVETKAVAEELGLPTVTTRRILEDLAAYQLAHRQGKGAGTADTWIAGDTEE